MIHTILAGFTLATTMLFPTPSATQHPDTERSVDTAIPARSPIVKEVIVTVTHAAQTTGAVELGFGTDTDGDGVLQPEETRQRILCDCGAWRVEKYGEATSSSLQNEDVEISFRSDGDVASPGNGGVSFPSATFTWRASAFPWTMAHYAVRGSSSEDLATTIDYKTWPFRVIVR